MSGIDRKIKRNKLKKQLGNNKICDYFHTEYDSLEKRMRKAKVGGAIYGANK